LASLVDDESELPELLAEESEPELDESEPDDSELLGEEVLLDDEA
jgi:hypothetical protein